METHYIDWLHLVLRWLHFITGAAWIGTSFYFNWLNHSMRTPDDEIYGVSGQLFSVHGGKFYEVRKYEGAPAVLPKTLHWFKWEAYFTWITGFCLLSVVYYLKPDLYLIDPSVAELNHAQAVLLGLLTLVGGWIVYDVLCRLLGKYPTLLIAIGLPLATWVAWGLMQVYSSRAAYIHVGAMLGTIMAANVFFVIIPGQRAMVDAMTKGQAPDVSKGAAGAMRSLHNNYLTLPVLFIMISNHFPMTYGDAGNWWLLLGICMAGALARHYFNLKHQGRHKQWILPAAAMAMVALAFVSRPPAPEDTGPKVEFAQAYGIMEARCMPCHVSNPTFPGMKAPPLGIAYDTPEQIKALSEKIAKVAVHSKTMPLANATQMTDEERDILGRWIAQGAEIPTIESTTQLSPNPTTAPETTTGKTEPN